MKTIFAGFFLLLSSPLSSAVEMEGRNFTNGFLDQYATLITLNRTHLGNSAGLILATTFLSAAVWTNLPQAVKDNIFGTFSSRVDEDQVEYVDTPHTTEATPTCDCEDYCYQTYFQHYYSSNVNGFESESRRRRR